ncbi:MAG: hypothetical protein K6G54_03285 [Oscillospiraceae bacterium]|nr:hypothetical protein [Oscillospiraceae bacterium]
MNKNHWLLRLAALLLASYTLLAVGVMATGAPGSETDPLVTLSYLNDSFLPQLLGKVDEKLDARDKALADKLGEQVAADKKALAKQYGVTDGASGTADSFCVVTLSEGQTLSGEVGCEVLLRSGTASCVATSAPGLVDETGGTTLNGGEALAANHLYLITAAGRGVRAAAAEVTLLVRGTYTVG